MSDAERFLSEARAAHRRFQVAAGSINSDGTIKVNPDDAIARTAVTEALNFRLAAEASDPQHSDPAWADDLAANRGVTHAALTEFYRTYLA